MEVFLFFVMPFSRKETRHNKSVSYNPRRVHDPSIENPTFSTQNFCAESNQKYNWNAIVVSPNPHFQIVSSLSVFSTNRRRNSTRISATQTFLAHGQLKVFRFPSWHAVIAYTQRPLWQTTDKLISNTGGFMLLCISPVPV